jgi:hypothetical protein
MGFGDYFKALRPAFDGCIVMALAVGFVRWKLPSMQGHWLRLMIEVSAGAAVYLATLALFHRGRLAYFLQIAKELRKPTG